MLIATPSLKTTKQIAREISWSFLELAKEKRRQGQHVALEEVKSKRLRGAVGECRIYPVRNGSGEILEYQEALPKPVDNFWVLPGDKTYHFQTVREGCYKSPL